MNLVSSSRKRKHADGQELSSSHTTVLNDESLGKESENNKREIPKKEVQKSKWKIKCFIYHVDIKFEF